MVTSLPRRWFPAAVVYETVYCGRGEMENRIKEQQLGLFADRTSTATMRGNQLRLWFAGFAYLLMAALQRIGLIGTELAMATCGTIRLKLLKIGAKPCADAPRPPEPQPNRRKSSRLARRAPTRSGPDAAIAPRASA